MSILHNVLLGLEITGIVSAGLILIPLLMATVRALWGGRIKPWIVGDVAPAEKLVSEEGWLHRSLVTFDISVNVILLRGQEDQTISTHAYIASLEGHLWGIAMTKWLNWIQPNHGQLAAAGDLERAKAQVALLSKLLDV